MKGLVGPFRGILCDCENFVDLRSQLYCTLVSWYIVRSDRQQICLAPTPKSRLLYS